MPLTKGTDMELFKATNISKRFGGVVALSGADFEFSGTKICGLVGANGSGKTTFARICAGLIKRDSGNFYINRKEVEINSPMDAKKYGIVLAHQNLSLVPDLTVWENIYLGHEEKQGKVFPNNRKARDLAAEILNDLVPGEISINSKLSSLSPAQKQLVEIAKALSQKPRLLILDEPTAPLEYFHVEKLFNRIKQLKEEEISIIFISHRLWEITRICDLVFVFRDGKTTGKVDFEKQPRDENIIVPLVTGSEICEVEFTRKEKRGLDSTKDILKLEDITFKDKLKKVNFDVKKGEIVGLGGLNGQGQEELVMLLAGALKPDSGKYLLMDKEVNIKHPGDAIKKGIYLVPGDRQEDGLFLEHDILKNVIYPRLTLKKEKFAMRLKELSDITKKIIDKISIQPPKVDMLVKNLSGGNQQKVVFGRWLQFKPNILLLNDPAKGIDIGAKNDLYKIVHELANKGTTIILYASSNEELVSNCDRVLIMFEGRIVDEINHEDLCDDKLIKSSLRVGKEASAAK
jgi:ribose transport system ATP-binding protein